MMTVCISERQRNVHVVAEAVALLVVVPFMAHVALSAEDKTTRTLAAAVGLGTLLVDG